MNIVLWIAFVERVDVGEQEEVGSVNHGRCDCAEGVVVPYLDFLCRVDIQQPVRTVGIVTLPLLITCRSR